MSGEAPGRGRKASTKGGRSSLATAKRQAASDGGRKSTRPLAAAKRLEATEGRLAWLREARRQATEMYAEARRDGSYVAAEKCLRAAAQHGQEITVLEAAELTGKGAQSEEAFVAELVERLNDLPTPYLELAVTEYLKRHPGMHLAADA